MLALRAGHVMRAAVLGPKRALLRRVASFDRLISERRRIARRAVDVQVENVKAVVVADDVMELLGFDAARDVDLGIDDTFVVSTVRR